MINNHSLHIIISKKKGSGLNVGLIKQTKASSYDCLFVYFAIIQSTFRLVKGQQYLKCMKNIRLDFFDVGQMNRQAILCNEIEGL